MSLLHHPRFTLYTSLLTLLIGVGLILWSGIDPRATDGARLTDTPPQHPVAPNPTAPEY